MLEVSGGINAYNVEAVDAAHLSGKVDIRSNLRARSIGIKFSSDSKVKGIVEGSDIVIKPALNNGSFVIGNSGFQNNLGSGNIIINGNNYSMCSSSVGGITFNSGSMHITCGPYSKSTVNDITIQGLEDRTLLSIGRYQHTLPGGYADLIVHGDRIVVHVDGKEFVFRRNGEPLTPYKTPRSETKDAIAPWKFSCDVIRAERSAELTNVVARKVIGRQVTTHEGCEISQFEQ